MSQHFGSFDVEVYDGEMGATERKPCFVCSHFVLGLNGSPFLSVQLSLLNLKFFCICLFFEAEFLFITLAILEFPV